MLKVISTASFPLDVEPRETTMFKDTLSHIGPPITALLVFILATATAGFAMDEFGISSSLRDLGTRIALRMNPTLAEGKLSY